MKEVDNKDAYDRTSVYFQTTIDESVLNISNCNKSFFPIRDSGKINVFPYATISRDPKCFRFFPFFCQYIPVYRDNEQPLIFPLYRKESPERGFIVCYLTMKIKYRFMIKQTIIKTHVQIVVGS